MPGVDSEESSESGSDDSEKDSDDSGTDDEINLRPPRYELPVQGEPHKRTDRRPKTRRGGMAQQPVRRGQRQRRPPDRFQAGQRNLQAEEYVIYVDPRDLVYA